MRLDDPLSECTLTKMPQSPKSIKLHAPRAAKACTSCHSRKIRCDVLKTGLPCTKCQLHGFECALAERKRRRPRGEKARDNEIARSHKETSSQSMPEYVLHQVPHYSFLRHFIPCVRVPRAENSQPGVFFPIPTHDLSTSSHSATSSLSAEESSYLRSRGVFDFPRKEHLDRCISAYFRYFHPFFPVINKCSFLSQYRSIRREGLEGLMDGQQMKPLLLNVMISTACPVSGH